MLRQIHCKKLVDIALFVLGLILVLIGIAFVLSPFPVGWMFITPGLLLMVLVSDRVRGFTRRRIEKYPKIESKLPQKVKDILNREGDNEIR